VCESWLNLIVTLLTAPVKFVIEMLVGYGVPGPSSGIVIGVALL